ncbi:PREDICTED: vacuolar protein-sorting-associated protein 37 homolog 1 [Nelumbo nucifera]|uniref:Vacuolar protein-sorting-associated protein 37 homolog 1 n=2 Tax=Nelumbo nucifera TaxID=4432 RepID=A0A1U7Z300_NELNU|nr:PREDICTED: vacuolar protein-sorting-associated protein 37 homolog 1 [Nelumbo nucifera]DAD28634.1 TPA_asm: hypothetical protein HUJ06_030102 [Nelumbo nucifera]
MSKSFWGSQEQQSQPRPQEASAQAWYPPSVVSSPSSTLPSTPSSSSSGFNIRPSEWPHPPSHGQLSPAEAACIINLLKDKSVDELRKLLSDKDAYNQFLLSLDQVRTQKKVRDELQKETLQLARDNLEKEPQISELRNQCRIIRTTELAAAQEKLSDLEGQEEETLKFFSPASLLQKLQEAMSKAEAESEVLRRQLLHGEIGLGDFIRNYKNLRTTYHRRALTHIAARTSYG